MAEIHTLQASAKLNLMLRIEGRNAARYHLLRMINVCIDLFDTVVLTENQEARDTISVSSSDLVRGRFQNGDEQRLVDWSVNSCTRAVKLFRDLTGLPHYFHIHVQKQIPSAAGLGGGSSDAAAVLKFLSLQQFPHDSSQQRCARMMPLALQLGADVPYFLSGGCAEVRGVGEKVVELPCVLRGREVALVVPPFGCATPDVYAAYRKKFPEIPSAYYEIGDPREWIEGRELSSRFIQLLINDLEVAALEIAPSLRSMMASLRSVPDAVGGMTGSGSVLFVLSKEAPEFDASQREAIRYAASQHGAEVVVHKIL